jgi:hypothetical protein
MAGRKRRESMRGFEAFQRMSFHEHVLGRTFCGTVDLIHRILRTSLLILDIWRHVAVVNKESFRQLK